MTSVPPRRPPAQQPKHESLVAARCSQLKAAGITGLPLFTALATYQIDLTESECENRCRRCWHDKLSRCICPFIPSITLTLLPVKVLVLMHNKEYFSAGDDAKLLLAMLPPSQSELYIFGKEGDWERLVAELSIDPTHTLLLWPGDSATTLDRYLSSLPPSSPWSPSFSSSSSSSPPSPLPPSSAVPSVSLPTLRVVVLDGVYNHASSMFRALTDPTRLPPSVIPPAVALHPKTLSVYHRATKGYGSSSAKTVVTKDLDPEALRICTVEAYALLLTEVGESSSVVDALVGAVLTNNQALQGDVNVRPEGGMARSERSGAARRRRARVEGRAKTAEAEKKESGTKDAPTTTCSSNDT